MAPVVAGLITSAWSLVPSTAAVLASGTGQDIRDERIADITPAADLNQGLPLAARADGDEVGAELGHDPAGQAWVREVMTGPPDRVSPPLGSGLNGWVGQVADPGVLVDRVHLTGDVTEAEAGGLLRPVITLCASVLPRSRVYSGGAARVSLRERAVRERTPSQRRRTGP